MWDFFGPIHEDRLQAVSDELRGHAEVVGLELCGKSNVYAWQKSGQAYVPRTTLFPGRSLESLRPIQLATRLIAVARQQRLTHLFTCHYEHTGITLAAILLRASGIPVFVLHISQFEDKPRWAWREAVKSLYLAPYCGALTSSRPAMAYLRFLGFKKPISLGYSTLSFSRMRALGGEGATDHSDRPFVCVSRFVPKKNLLHTIDCYAAYVNASAAPAHKLVLIGDGPLRTEIEAHVRRLQLSDRVELTGFLQAPAIAQRLRTALCLLLLSSEEQFGNVVIEAQALSIPVILSNRCGARDLIRNFTNGFVVEPDNVDGTAAFMSLLADEEALWRKLSSGAARSADQGDATAFAAGVRTLMQGQ